MKVQMLKLQIIIPPKIIESTCQKFGPVRLSSAMSFRTNEPLTIDSVLCRQLTYDSWRILTAPLSLGESCKIVISPKDI